MVLQPTLTRKDFVTDQEVRWCPGCGDYSILAQAQKVMPELGVPREKIVFVSGIGCSSRFPYYMHTWLPHHSWPCACHCQGSSQPARSHGMGDHGDGDALSIGGNHLLHVLRRNVDVKVVLFNNRIYGLTKGQYSPTSELGKKGVKSAPLGVPDHPLNPLSVAIGAEATFVARTIDTDTKHLIATVERAAAHKGAAFIEVYQNCNVYNDGAFAYLTEREVHNERTLYLEHGKPMLFGKERNRGIRLRGLDPEIVTLGEDGVTEDDVLRHDETKPAASLAYILSRLDYPDFPVPVGVLRAVERPTYDGIIEEQEALAIQRSGPGDLDKMFNSGDTWVVD